MLKLTDLRKAFGATRAVDGVSFEVGRGEVFGLLGPNGAGKTTTVNLAVGLIEPDAGSVVLDGSSSPAEPAARRSIGVAPQSLAIYEDLSGEANLRFFGRLYGLRGARLAERVAWALEFVGLSGRRRDLVSAYSGGMKRRLNLAVALVNDPQLLLLDEPTVGVDPQSRNAIFESIRLLRDEGRAVLYTTHYMEEAQRLCDRVAIMDQGRLLALDTVPALIAAHGGKSIVTAQVNGEELRAETDDPVAELERFQRRGRLSHFSVEGANLESVFLNLTGRHLRD
jgi:ABC-2 type transport system ATP-binding protein